jgi:hypothetical protein
MVENSQSLKIEWLALKNDTGNIDYPRESLASLKEISHTSMAGWTPGTQMALPCLDDIFRDQGENQDVAPELKQYDTVYVWIHGELLRNAERKRWLTRIVPLDLLILFSHSRNENLSGSEK